MMKVGRWGWVVGVGVAVAGCGGAGGEDLGPSGGQVEGGPAFLIGTRVWDDAATTSYFHVVGSLDRETEVDGARALEIPGDANLYAVPGIGWFAISSGDDPTIVRYTLTEDNELVEDERVSLQPYGVKSLWDTLYPVSRTKLYYPDREGQQLIIINPEAMTIDGTVDLAETGREGFLANYGYTAIERGGKLLISVGWFDWNENDAVLGETGLVVLDTETDTVERFDVDARCGGITQPVVTESGDAYLASSALAAAAHELGRLDTAPCALRIRDGETAIDAGYFRLLGELTGDDLAGEPIPGGGSDIYLRVLDDDLAMLEEGQATWEITGQAAWRWASWNVEDDELTLLESLEPATSDVMWFAVDGRVFGAQTTADYAETTLIELRPSGQVQELLTVPGFMHGLAKLR